MPDSCTAPLPAYLREKGSLEDPWVFRLLQPRCILVVVAGFSLSLAPSAELIRGEKLLLNQPVTNSLCRAGGAGQHGSLLFRAITERTHHVLTCRLSAAAPPGVI